MRRWQVNVELVDDARLPVFRQIAAAIVADIERGRLRPGERLPSSRILSNQLGVNRNTVLAAYDDLCARGVIRGDHRLRAALGDLLARVRGIPAGPDAICVTRGSQGGCTWRRARWSGRATSSPSRNMDSSRPGRRCASRAPS